MTLVRSVHTNSERISRLRFLSPASAYIFGRCAPVVPNALTSQTPYAWHGRTPAIEARDAIDSKADLLSDCFRQGCN